MRTCGGGSGLATGVRNPHGRQVRMWTCRTGSGLVVVPWIVLSVSVQPVSGGRYSDPAEAAKLIVPFVISGFVFIGMLGLLCFFKRDQIRKMCCKCCLQRENPEPDSAGDHRATGDGPTQGVSVTSINPRMPSDQPPARLPANNNNTHVSKEPATDSRQCPGCGSEYPQHQKPPADTPSTVRWYRRFLRPKHSQENPSKSKPDTESPEDEEATCGNCFKLEFQRKALKSRDITHVKLTIETPEACHI